MPNTTVMLYEKLKELYKDKDIPYSALLMTEEWIKRRLEVLKQTNACCLRCEETGTYLNNDGRLVRLVKATTDANQEAGAYDWMEDFVSRPVYLEVYPKVLNFQKLIWEYRDEDLFICCSLCIQELHLKYGSPIFWESSRGHTMTCPKCEGTGALEQFDHINNGICFRCRGRGKIIIP